MYYIHVLCVSYICFSYAVFICNICLCFTSCRILPINTSKSKLAVNHCMFNTVAMPILYVVRYGRQITSCI